MTQRTFEIEKRELGDGWVEVRIVTFRPTRTSDFTAKGFEARKQIAKLFLSGASGIADAMGFPQVSGLLTDLWGEFERRFPR